MAAPLATSRLRAPQLAPRIVITPQVAAPQDASEANPQGTPRGTPPGTPQVAPAASAVASALAPAAEVAALALRVAHPALDPDCSEAELEAAVEEAAVVRGWAMARERRSELALERAALTDEVAELRRRVAARRDLRARLEAELAELQLEARAREAGCHDPASLRVLDLPRGALPETLAELEARVARYRAREADAAAALAAFRPRLEGHSALVAKRAELDRRAAVRDGLARQAATSAGLSEDLAQARAQLAERRATLAALQERFERLVNAID